MRPSRVFRTIIRIFILFLTGSFSAISILGGISAVNILQDPGNIAIPSGPIVNYDLNISDPSGMYLEIPYSLTNAGYFDITDVAFGMTIYMVYNISRITTIIFEDTTTLPNIIHGQIQTGIYNATAFIVANIPAPNHIDNSTTIDFYSDIMFRATYSLGLLSFVVNIYNQTISP
jgi:hypothetical protein